MSIWKQPIGLILKIGVVINIITFLIFLTALATLYIRQFHPNVVNQIDNNLVSNHRWRFVHQYTDIKKQIENKEKSAEKYQNLLKDLKNIGCADKLHIIKRNIFQDLFDLYIEMHKLTEASGIIKEWIAFDEQDVNAALCQAVLFDQLGEARKARDFFENLFNTYSNAYNVAERYLKFLLSKNDYISTFGVATKYLKEAELFYNQQVSTRIAYFDQYRKTILLKGMALNPLQIYKTAAPLFQKQKVILEANTNVNMISELRFDLWNLNKSYTYLIKDMVISLRTNSSPNNYQLKEPRFQRDLSILDSGAAFLVTGQKPLIFLNLPKNLAGYSGAFVINVEYTLETAKVPFSLASFLNDPHWALYVTANTDDFLENEKIEIHWKHNNDTIFGQFNLQGRSHAVQDLQITGPHLTSSFAEQVQFQIDYIDSGPKDSQRLKTIQCRKDQIAFNDHKTAKINIHLPRPVVIKNVSIFFRKNNA